MTPGARIVPVTKAPPPRTSRSLMIRAVAYKMQERELGGLSAATRRLLYGQGPAPVRRRRALNPGSVLVRESAGWPVGRPALAQAILRPQPRLLGGFSNLHNRGRSARIADLVYLNGRSV